jgi:hypothetical protein
MARRAGPSLHPDMFDVIGGSAAMSATISFGTDLECAGESVAQHHVGRARAIQEALPL